MKVFSLLLCACALAGCAAQTIPSGRRAVFTATASREQPKVVSGVASNLKPAMLAKPAKKAHASREAAVSLLRREGILHGSTQVLAADWGENTHKWLIILKHPGGTVSHWFIDAAAKDYSGGTCRH